MRGSSDGRWKPGTYSNSLQLYSYQNITNGEANISTFDKLYYTGIPRLFPILKILARQKNGCLHSTHWRYYTLECTSWHCSVGAWLPICANRIPRKSRGYDEYTGPTWPAIKACQDHSEHRQVCVLKVHCHSGSGHKSIRLRIFSVRHHRHQVQQVWSEEEETKPVLNSRVVLATALTNTAMNFEEIAHPRRSYLLRGAVLWSRDGRAAVL